MTMIVRRFKRFFKRKGRFQKGGSNYKKDISKEKAPVCFECKKPGHFKAECPSLQRYKEKDIKKEKYGDKKKAFVGSIWGDSSEDEEEEEAANLSLVAQERSDDSDHENTEVNDSKNYDLQDEYNSLVTEFYKLAKEVSTLRKENKKLREKSDIAISPKSDTAIRSESNTAISKIGRAHV